MSCLPVVLVLALAPGAELPADFTLPPAPGPHVAKASQQDNGSAFRSGEPLVATSYFYWYDAESKSHVIDHDGSDALTDHPPTLEGFSYKNVDWHREQLLDMIAAGIDVAMPVYWGTPLGHENWSDLGLPKLVAARERLLAEGKRPPAIGLFYDTSTLQFSNGGYHIDLTTPAGRLWFYGTIRNFFSQIPPKHRAAIDGKPLVFLYASAFAKRVDESLFPAVREMFQRDFGSDLYLVKMRGWPGKADSEYEWGGALAPQFLDTAAIGPGYDHSAVPGRTPLVRSREDGQFYQKAWQRLLVKEPDKRPWLVHVETWNEFHEGTDVCESREFGRKYIELTRTFADQFHARRKLDRSVLGPVRTQGTASPGRSEGVAIAPKPDGDGPVVEKAIQGRAAWSTTQNKHSPTTRYLYFNVDEGFLYDADESVEVTVSYLDAGPKEFLIEYDSSDEKLEGLRQQFREGPRQAIEGTGEWKETRFTLAHARFADRANGADFRLTALGSDLVVSQVSVRVLAATASATAEKSQAKSLVHDLTPLHDPARILVNPHKGWYHHFPDNHPDKYQIARDADLLEFPGMDHLYIRLAWSYLEPKEGQFDWAVIDRIIEKWTAHGLGIAFRISCKETSTDRIEQQFATPRWVMEAGAKGGYYRSGKAVGPDGPWEPAFDDPIFLAKLDNFLAAFAARYDRQPWVRYVDIGSIGDWGEGHTYAGSRKECGFAARKQHVDLHLKHFKHALLVATDDYVYALSDPAERQTLHQYLLDKGISYRDDSIMVNGYFPGASDRFTVRSPEFFADAYLRTPTVFELEHYGAVKKLGNWEGRADSAVAKYGKGKKGADFCRGALELLHASYIGYHGDARQWLTDNPELTRELLNRCGYWLFPKSIELPATLVAGTRLPLALTVENRGVAPPYAPYELRVKLAGDGGSVVQVLAKGCKSWLPGEPVRSSYEFQLPPDVKPGKYWLAIGLFDSSTGKERPVDFALKASAGDAEGYYRLVPVSVATGIR